MARIKKKVIGSKFIGLLTWIINRIYEIRS